MLLSGLARERVLRDNIGMDQLGNAAELERLISKLKVQAPEMWRLTERWVRVNSYSGNVHGVNRVGALLAEAFALPELTLRVERAAPGYGDHLFWSSARAAEAPPIL